MKVLNGRVMNINKPMQAALCAGAIGLGVTAAAGLGVVAAMKNKRQRRSLAGRVALLTGGSRGLGLELARKLAAHRCRLILVARSEEELSRAEAELVAGGAQVRTIVCDLTNEGELHRMVESARGCFGRIDILINDAGIISVAPVEASSEDDFRAAMDLMFWAAFRTTMSLLPEFLRSGDADVVNITSIGGKIPVPHLLSYTAAKFAITGFSEGLSTEVRSRGVHVLTVTPGLMRTGSHLHAEFAGNQQKEYRWFALGASMPGSSMQISRAATQIVDALIDRKRELVLTLAARSAARIFGAAPGPSLMLLQAVNDFILPKADPASSKRKGHELHAEQPAVFRGATILGTKAAETQHQF